jgi:predicted nuclease of predicted toxin-antitoxin system
MFGVCQRRAQIGAGLPVTDLKDRTVRLLVNENVTKTVIEELRQRGHDVISVKESMRSEQDEVIVARAHAQKRLLATHDKDFGELAFRSKLPASCGIILFRLAGSDPDTDNQRIIEALESHTN